ncbi:MAG: cell division ATP-binding protein FtsE [bacterium]|nr:cell division ATP-binding protein FtsE [bacterium]
MIEFINVERKFKSGDFEIENINLTINDGEFVFLVGASGAGKTSLLKLLIREELPSSGEIKVDGESVQKLKPSQIPMLRRKIGMVFQDFRLLETRTVFDNVAISLEVAGKKKAEIKEIVPRILKLVGLAGQINHYPSQLSGGEKQRVSLARAIAHDPKYLVADEPTGNIDPKATWELMQLFQKINDFGTTIIFATHDKVVVDQLKKRVVTIENGKIIKDQINSTYE